MTGIDTILLPVADPEASARFYAGILGREPVERSPTFVLFAGPGMPALGLWRRDGMLPAPAAPGGSELGLKQDDPAQVDATHAAWRDRGVAILMPPSELDFGRSFVAQDPDGHRLRVYALREE